MALFPEPYGTPIHLSLNLTDLGLVKYQNYDIFESFTGQYMGKYRAIDNYNFSVNPAGDVHAFYAEPASANKGILKKSL